MPRKSIELSLIMLSHLRIQRLRACLVSKSGVFAFHFLYSIFKILNLNIKKKKNSFSHLVVFGKLFWIHNLSIKYIISGFGHCFLFFIFFKKSKFSHLHTITSLKKSNFVFSQYLQICHCIHIHGKWKRWKVVFIFLYSNPTFRVLKMKTEYKC